MTQLSEQTQTWIDLFRAGKEAAKAHPAPMTPESVREARKNNDLAAAAFPTAEGITFAPATAGIHGEYYTYDESDPGKDRRHILLLLHGGGMTDGTIPSRRYLFTQIVKYARMDGFAPDYSQWPEARHPTALGELETVFRALLERGYAAGDIYIFGESAGAQLALTLPLFLKERDVPLPGKVCAFSPVGRLDREPPSRRDRDGRDPMIPGDINDRMPYYPAEGRDSPLVSPVYGDFAGFPPTLLMVGTEEVLYDDALELYRNMTVSGRDCTLREYEGLFHVFPMVPAPESEAAQREIGAFFRK